jgi:hypothetical protein
MGVELAATKEGRPGDVSCHTGLTAAAATNVTTIPTEVTASATDAAIVPTEATAFATDPVPTNHGLSNSRVAPGSTLVIVKQNPDVERKLEQFIREMEKEGALVAVMRGEVSQPPCSSGN